MAEEIPRSEKPHHATVTMKIDVREMTQNGEVLHSVLGETALNKYGLSLYQIAESIKYHITEIGSIDGASFIGLIKRISKSKLITNINLQKNFY